MMRSMLRWTNGQNEAAHRVRNFDTPVLKSARFDSTSKKIEITRAKAATSLMFSYGVASEKMKIRMIMDE